ncbi:gas vesicle protein GvpL/GvpF [Archangium gephyra]|uniref:Gas vesicle protein GvpL/GvpF n=1 Tax=Archangium gephyra TaxID=48 RepID=A0AAC8TD68_9BACT|nr:GvpL/GvpF family gas vesicle protein [Archangium gephyra]AKJ01650.1 gas vesicle synthesis protein [Archangium gephyra]REG34463.1 gas vesicle protein GvpL/GvpF [Archangium gephyra]
MTDRARLLLYCIADARAALPHGARAEGLQRIEHGGLVALVSPLAESARVEEPTKADLLEYAHVIRSQHAVADVVPMRFGSVLSGEVAVRAHLDEQRDTYVRALTRVTGCVELGVRVLLSVSPPPLVPDLAVKPMSHSGAAYLESRRRHYSAENRLREQCEALEQSLLSKVAPLCREHRTEFPAPRPDSPALCSLYFLVPREQVLAFRTALASIPVENTDIALSGPWPPFNFVA